MDLNPFWSHRLFCAFFPTVGLNPFLQASWIFHSVLSLPPFSVQQLRSVAFELHLKPQDLISSNSRQGAIQHFGRDLLNGLNPMVNIFCFSLQKLTLDKWQFQYHQVAIQWGHMASLPLINLDTLLHLKNKDVTGNIIVLQIVNHC